MPPNADLNIFGVKINRLSWPELEAFCSSALTGSKPVHIVTANGEILLKAADNNGYKAVLNSADLVIPDSTNVALVAAVKGKPLTDITPGSDLTQRLAKLAATMGQSIFLLGAQAGVAEKAGIILKNKFPKLIIAGTSSANPDDPTAVELVKKSGAAVILVAYGAPKQEQWIAAHKDQTKAKILIGVGGTFDMLAGVTPRSPKLMRQLHLEWLWRLILQPSRLSRVVDSVIVFPIKAILWKNGA